VLYIYLRESFQHSGPALQHCACSYSNSRSPSYHYHYTKLPRCNSIGHARSPRHSSMYFFATGKIPSSSNINNVTFLWFSSSTHTFPSAAATTGAATFISCRTQPPTLGPMFLSSTASLRGTCSLVVVFVFGFTAIVPFHPFVLVQDQGCF
jgi:hypothetical protein